MLDAATKIGIIGGIFIFFALVIIFIVCLLGPCPLNLFIFGSAIYPKYYYDSQDKSSKAGIYGPYLPGQMSPEERKKQMKTEYDLINTSLYRAYDSFESNGGIPPEVDGGDTPQLSVNSTPHKMTPGEPPVTIVFTVQYTEHTHTLVFSLDKVKDSPGPLIGLWHNNYLRIQLIKSSNKKRAADGSVIAEASSRVVSKTPHPTFDEVLQLQVPVDSSVMEHAVRVLFCDKSSHGNCEKVVAEMQFGLDQIDLRDCVKFNEAMRYPKHEPKGELLVSLSYLPTSEKLNLVILKARGLKPVEGRTADPYVKVQVLIDGETRQKKRTEVRAAELNPIFNETLVLDVPLDLLQQVICIIQVMHCTGKQRVRSRTDRLMGTCALGERCYSLGGDHWRGMQHSPRRHVAVWQPLR